MSIGTHSYNQSIRFYNAVFMEVFNDIYLKRLNKNIKVPIEWTDKRKEEVLKDENPGGAYSKNISLPRMSFRLTNMQFAAYRNKNKNLTISGNGNSTFNRKPFDFTYDLHIKTKNMVDLYEILEQIHIQFDPYLELNVIDNEDMNINSNIAIDMVTSGLDTLSEGIYAEESNVETTMTFTLKGYLYYGKQESKVIKKIILNYYDFDKGGKLTTDTITENGIDYGD